MNLSHSGNAGDIMAHFACMAGLATKYKCRPHLYLKLDHPAEYYAGAVHPCGNVRMNKDIADMLIPLAECQPYLSGCSIWDGEEIDLDLDLFRYIDFDFSRGSITKWPFFAIHSWYDLSKPWIFVEKFPYFENAIIVNRTSRYRNKYINYKFLSGRKDVFFVGLPDEYDEFKESCDVEYIPIHSFLELAMILKGCKMFIGNQSMAFNLAEGLKIPRILEVSSRTPNVISCGGYCIDVINQVAFEQAVEDINLLLSEV